MVKRACGAAVFAVIALAADVAWACSCDPRPVAESFKNADMVARVTITGLNMNLKSGLVRVDFEVLESFKRQPPTVQTSVYTVRFHSSCFGYHLDIGRDYLLFATAPGRFPEGFKPPDLPPGGMIVSMCGGTAEIPSLRGNRELPELRKLLKWR